jgi:hypothetical protein
MSEPRADLRRYPRARVAWKVIVDMPGSRPRMRKTVDVSPFGVKIRWDGRVADGVTARLSFSTPDHLPFQVNAVVLRSDADGPVFVFVGITDAEITRMKLLVDSYRAP